MSTFLPVGGGTYTLNSSISSTATSITLTSFTEPVSGTPYTMALIGSDIAYATIAPRTTSSEFVSFTGITQNADGTATLTGVTRGLAKKTPFTSSSTFKLPHSGQTLFILSDAPQVFNKYVTLENAETITGLKTFPGGGSASAPVSGTVYAAPTNNLEYASKKYVDDTASFGAPLASTIVAGIVELATAAETAAGTTTGGTGAALVPQNATFNATSSSTILVPVTNSSGKLSAGFGGAASSLATLDGSSLVVQNPANATATPTASKIPIASGSGKLNEGWLQMTDAQASTLTAGNTSEASSLHYHRITVNDYNQRQIFIGSAADAMTTAGVGTEVIARNYTQSSFTTGTSTNDTAVGTIITSTNGGIGDGWAKSLEIQGRFKVSSTSAMRSNMAIAEGLSGSGVLTSTATIDHFGFIVENGTLYASSADGTTQQRTDVSSGITLTNFNTYRAVFTAATSVTFYINGTLVATHSTNYPGGAIGSDLTFTLGTITTTTAAKTLTFYNDYVVAQSF